MSDNREPRPLSQIMNRLTATHAAKQAELARRDAERAAFLASPEGIAQATREAQLRRQRIEQDKAMVADARWKSLANNIGWRYSRCDFDNFHATSAAQRQALTRVREFVANLAEHVANGVGLLLVGPPGTGKDHLLVAALRGAIAAGHNPAWFDGAELQANWRAMVKEGSAESVALAKLVTPSILAISDPLPVSGELSDWSRSWWSRLVDGRYRESRPTWLTMNLLDDKEMTRRFGPPIADRLLDNAIVVVCNWPSYRRR